MYNLISSIQAIRVCPEVKNWMVWKFSKDGFFSVNSLHGVSEGMKAGVFPTNLVSLHKLSFLHWRLGGEGKSFGVRYFRSKKKGRHLANRFPHSGEDEENTCRFILSNL